MCLLALSGGAFATSGATRRTHPVSYDAIDDEVFRVSTPDPGWEGLTTFESSYTLWVDVQISNSDWARGVLVEASQRLNSTQREVVRAQVERGREVARGRIALRTVAAAQAGSRRSATIRRCETMSLARVARADLVFGKTVETEEHVIRLECFECRTCDRTPAGREIGLVIERAEDLERGEIVRPVEAGEDFCAHRGRDRRRVLRK